MIADRISKERKADREFTLRMSNIGSPCARKLWLEKNQSESKEALDAPTLMKFLIGDLTEEVLIFLAEVSGHSVEGRQDESDICGIKGHRDCIIDGTLVDVKSASSYSYDKFKSHLTSDNDSFGYITQLGSYLHASQGDPLVLDKDKAAFLVLDKQHGHICLDFHEKTDFDWEAAYERRIAVVNSEEIPDRAFDPEPDGYKNYKTGEFVQNGNEVLGVNCSYCNMKSACYPEIRTFLSSRGPKFFTKIVKEPKMFEVKQGTEGELKEGEPLPEPELEDVAG